MPCSFALLVNRLYGLILSLAAQNYVSSRLQTKQHGAELDKYGLQPKWLNIECKRLIRTTVINPTMRFQSDASDDVSFLPSRIDTTQAGHAWGTACIFKESKLLRKSLAYTMKPTGSTALYLELGGSCNRG